MTDRHSHDAFTLVAIASELEIEKRRGVPHLPCGKIAAGKSSLARRLVARDAAVLAREDFWTTRLWAILR